jgi:GT2 family glycosyltransferase
MHELTAVTGACLLTPRDLYSRLGGMNDEHLAVAFNDVDYCLKVRAAGRRVIYTPHAEFVHHESVSRGHEDTPEKARRFQGEVKYMMTTWAEWLKHDHAYNPNLTLADETFGLAACPRVRAMDWLFPEGEWGGEIQ